MTVHHSLTGVGTCGKSVALKEIIIPAHRAAGRAVIVLDPLNAQWKHATVVTDDPMRFVETLKRSANCVGIVDEVRVFREDYDAMMQLEWCFFAGRNRGHLMYAAAQRIMMIPPNIREQCGQALVFQQTARSLEVLAEDMNQPAIMLAAGLPRGQCLIIAPFKDPVWYEVFDVNAPTFRLTRRTLGYARDGKLIKLADLKGDKKRVSGMYVNNNTTNLNSHTRKQAEKPAFPPAPASRPARGMPAPVSTDAAESAVNRQGRLAPPTR